MWKLVIYVCQAVAMYSFYFFKNSNKQNNPIFKFMHYMKKNRLLYPLIHVKNMHNKNVFVLFKEILIICVGHTVVVPLYYPFLLKGFHFLHLLHGDPFHNSLE